MDSDKKTLQLNSDVAEIELLNKLQRVTQTKRKLTLAQFEYEDARAGADQAVEAFADARRKYLADRSS